MKKTLEEILKEEKARRVKKGAYSIDECKKCILWDEKFLHKDLLGQLNVFVERANEDIFFNRQMVLACWELIQERMK